MSVLLQSHASQAVLRSPATSIAITAAERSRYLDQLQPGLANASPCVLSICNDKALCVGYMLLLLRVAAAADPLVQDAIIAQARSAVGSTNMNFGGVTKGTYQAT
jgi:hypothetical protein